MPAAKPRASDPPLPAVPSRWLVRVVALGAAICGTVALALWAPRLVGALVWLRADSALAVAERGEGPPPEALERLLGSSYAAPVWHDDSRAWLAIGLARLDSARHGVGDSARQRRLLDGAIFALDRGLSMAPRNGAAWMRLGEALILRAGASPRAARALDMSLRAAPVAPELAVERLALLFVTWDLFDASHQATIAGQIEMARRDPNTAGALAALMRTPDGRRVAADIAAGSAR